MGDHDGHASANLILRPAREEDLPVLEALTWDPATAGEFAQFGWFDPQLWRRRWAENQLLGPDGGVLMVTCGQETLGLIRADLPS